MIENAVTQRAFAQYNLEIFNFILVDNVLYFEAVLVRLVKLHYSIKDRIVDIVDIYAI